MRKVERKGLWLLAALVGAIGCSNGDGNSRETSASSVAPVAVEDAHQKLVDARALAQLPIGSDPRVTWDRQAKGLVPGFGAEKRRLVDITLPSSAHDAFSIRDAASGLEARFRLEGATPRAVALASSVAVYAGAGPSGSDVMVTVSPSGIEDFVLFHAPPASPLLRYSLAMPKGSGLRLVSGVLEMVDAKGAPRLRVEPPYVANRDGRAKATLAVEECAVDTSPRAPWGRAVVNPGQTSCTVVVDFSKAGLSYPLVVDPAWSATQNGISSARSHLSGTSFVLDADVSDTTPPITLFLAAGGYGVNGDASASAELYEPVTRTFAVTGNLGTPRGEHAATLLPGTLGQILVTGGRTKSGSGTPLNSVELYDELTGTFASKGNLSTSRYAHTATLYKSGALNKVLIAAGTTTLGQNTKNCEIYDVATGTLTSTNLMNTARAHHTAVFLDPTYVNTSGLTGKVLVVGGTIFGNALFAAELYDPSSGVFQITVPNINLSATRSRAYHTATLLNDGTVFVAGGRTADTSGTLHDAELFGPSGFPGSLIELTDLRAEHTASFLPNGDLVLVAGHDGTSAINTTTIFTPSTGAVAQGPSLATARFAHAGGEALQGQSFSSGEGVLVVGGTGVAGVLASAEVLGRANGDFCTLDEECQSNFCVTEPIDPNDPNSATESRCCNSDCKDLCKTCRDLDPNLHGTCDFYQQTVSIGSQCVGPEIDGTGGGGGSSASGSGGAGGAAGGSGVGGSGGSSSVGSAGTGGGNSGPQYVEIELACAPGGEIKVIHQKACDPNTCDDTKTHCTETCRDPAISGSPNPCAESGYCDDTPDTPPVGSNPAACDTAQPIVGRCLDKRLGGQACDHCYECASNFCVDGVCCGDACGSDLATDEQKIAVQCEACDVLTNGTCTVVKDGDAPHGSTLASPVRPACNTDGTVCGGQCGGGSSCAYPDETTVDCNPQTCACDESDCTQTSYHCDGKGACVPEQKACNGSICEGDACKEDCLSYDDCIAGFRCTSVDGTTPGTCEAIAGPICDDRNTVLFPDASRADCTPYICADGACRTTCGSVDDCVAPTVCSPEGKCVSRVENPEVEVGGCAVHAPRGDNDDALWLALLAASAVLIRRRR